MNPRFVQKDAILLWLYLQNKFLKVVTNFLFFLKSKLLNVLDIWKGISMPKMKSVKAASKRFSKTASGRLKRGKAYASHILKKKTTKRKRNYRRPGFLSSADEKRIKKLIV